MISCRSIITLIVVIVLAFIVLSVFFTFFPVTLWISALAAGVKVSIFTLSRNEVTSSYSDHVL